MFELIKLGVGLLVAMLRSRAAIQAENLALRSGGRIRTGDLICS